MLKNKTTLLDLRKNPTFSDLPDERQTVFSAVNVATATSPSDKKDLSSPMIKSDEHTILRKSSLMHGLGFSVMVCVLMFGAMNKTTHASACGTGALSMVQANIFAKVNMNNGTNYYSNNFDFYVQPSVPEGINLSQEFYNSIGIYYGNGEEDPRAQLLRRSMFYPGGWGGATVPPDYGPTLEGGIILERKNINAVNGGNMYSCDTMTGDGAQPAYAFGSRDESNGNYILDCLGGINDNANSASFGFHLNSVNDLPGAAPGAPVRSKYTVNTRDFGWSPTAGQDLNNGNVLRGTFELTQQARIEPTFTPHTEGVVDFEKGSGDIVVKQYVTIKPGCNVNANSSFVWNTSGDVGPNVPNTTVIVDNICDTPEYNTPVSTATIPASYLNDKDPGYSYNRITTVVGQSSDSRNGTVYEVPYVNFKGHDIYATGTGSVPAGGIQPGSIFFNTASGNRGSTDQYASIANHATNLIITAAERSGAPMPPDGLKAQWAGNVPQSAYDTITKNGSLPQNPTRTNYIGLGSEGYYTSTTPIDVSGSGITKKVTVKAPTINITSDIYTSVPGGTFNDKTTPVVLLVSDGDINISPNVTRIDAILIAKGKINTCFGPARGDWEQPQPTGCRNPLTINGAMGASFINFGRSIGTRLIATSPTNPPAEEIKYPGYLNFATPYLRDTSASSSNAIFNAPPLL